MLEIDLTTFSSNKSRQLSEVRAVKQARVIIYKLWLANQVTWYNCSPVLAQYLSNVTSGKDTCEKNYNIAGFLTETDLDLRHLIGRDTQDLGQLLWKYRQRSQFLIDKFIIIT